MQKDFTNWNIKKTKIDTIEKRPFFHVGEVWSCYLGANVGYEQDGKGDDFMRPVVVIKKFGADTFWGIPLTTKVKKDKSYFFTFTFIEGVVSTAVLSQIRLIDARRLGYLVGNIHIDDFEKLKKKLKELFP
jgi:mRNA interferase MazF